MAFIAQVVKQSALKNTNLMGLTGAYWKGNKLYVQ
jgi:hypothetical protein